MTVEHHKLPFFKVRFPSFATAEKLALDVEAERDFWMKFGLHPFSGLDYSLLEPNYAGVASMAREGVFRESLGRTSWGNRFLLFPHRDSAEGVLLADLLTADEEDSARNLLFALHVEEQWIQHTPYRGDPRGAVAEARCAEGRSLLVLARLGYARRDRAAVASLNWEKKRLNTQVAEIEALAEESRRVLAAVQDVHQDTVDRSRHKLGVLVRWQKAAVASNRRRIDSQFRNWQMDWDATRASFVDELRYRAPIAHWDKVATAHEKRADRLWGLFVLTLVSLALLSVSVSWALGDQIAAAFRPTDCPTWVPACLTAVSPKGPLVIGSILLCSSFGIWLLRMLSKMHLSERHLARAAAEKRSFTEAFLALRKEHGVSEAQEAIVMGSIFRPSQDGFVADDDGGVDLTGPALLARAFSGRQ